MKFNLDVTLTASFEINIALDNLLLIRHRDINWTDEHQNLWNFKEFLGHIDLKAMTWCRIKD